jgi:hypothetical protein
MSHHKQLVLATLGYESRHGNFPGYVNRIATGEDEDYVVASWIVALFPYLDRRDLWIGWESGDKPAPFLQVMVCPADRSGGSSSGLPPLSYVVNCGQPGDSDTPAHGIFHNHEVDSNMQLVSWDYISKHDGSGYTLMMSENIQAGYWTDTEEVNVGMVWLDRPGPSSRINRDKNAGDRPEDARFARPSSNHPGGVVANYCDGRTVFLHETIDYNVYQHLMTPDSKEAGVAGEFDPGNLQAKPGQG